jgi:hypothetical protein
MWTTSAEARTTLARQMRDPYRCKIATLVIEMLARICPYAWISHISLLYRRIQSGFSRKHANLVAAAAARVAFITFDSMFITCYMRRRHVRYQRENMGGGYQPDSNKLTLLDGRNT